MGLTGALACIAGCHGPGICERAMKIYHVPNSSLGLSYCQVRAHTGINSIPSWIQSYALPLNSSDYGLVT